jgi:small-conductance mechanosensitive channel
MGSARRGANRVAGVAVAAHLLCAGAALARDPSAAPALSPAPTSNPAPTSSPAPASRAAASPSLPAAVRVGEAVAFTLSADAQGKSAKERAARASAAIAGVLEQPEPGELHVERTPDSAILFVGTTAIVELTPLDATLAGDASLEAFAHDRAGALARALASERQRSRIAETVFSCSLVVFFALIAFYLIKRLANLAERARCWLEEHGDRNLAISVKSIELVRPAVVKSTAVIALGLTRWLGQFGILYAWLVVVLSLFETTRGYTERLTGFVLSPLSLLLGRSLAALPLLVVAGFAAIAIFVLVRFTGLFLASVARRETHLAWLPSDLAGPASVLLRIAIVVGALVFAAPIVTGSSDDSLGRTGTIVLWALGIAATPLLATGLLGAAILFDRRLGIGDHVRVRGELGRIIGINLLELRLLSPTGSEWRVPHLLLLTSPLERLGATPRLSVELCAARELAPERVLEALVAAGNRLGTQALAEISEVQPSQVRYRLTATLASLAERSGLLHAALEGIAGVELRLPTVDARSTGARATDDAAIDATGPAGTASGKSASEGPQAGAKPEPARSR